MRGKFIYAGNPTSYFNSESLQRQHALYTCLLSEECQEKDRIRESNYERNCEFEMAQSDGANTWLSIQSQVRSLVIQTA